MQVREVWDAVDADGHKLGFDLYRDEWNTPRCPKDAYHQVVQIIVVTQQHEVLVTQRDPHKPFGLKWEITGGSILKGETPLAGAVRELREETGIAVSEEDLTLIDRQVRNDPATIYNVYVVTVSDRNVAVTLQPGETIDYRFLPFEDFVRAAHHEDYVLWCIQTCEMQLRAYVHAIE